MFLERQVLWSNIRTGHILIKRKAKCSFWLSTKQKKVFFSASGFGLDAAQGREKSTECCFSSSHQWELSFHYSKRNARVWMRQKENWPRWLCCPTKRCEIHVKVKNVLPYLPGGICRCGPTAQFDISRTFFFFFLCNIHCNFPKVKIQT